MTDKVLTAQLKLIANSVPVHLLYLNMEDRIIFANKACAEFWKDLNVELVGRTVKEIVDPQAYTELVPVMEKVRSGQEVVNPNPFIKPDGTIRYFENTYIPDFDSSGKVQGYVVSGVDLTERILAEENFRILADTMPQVIWTSTPDGHLDYFNKNWYDYSGFKPGTTGEEQWKSLIHEDDISNLEIKWDEALRTGEAYEAEFRVKKTITNEYRWWLVRATPVKNSYGNVVKWYGASTDIHDLKKLQYNLMSEKDMRDKFTSTLSHDLRTPLAGAKMAAQFLLKKHEGKEGEHKLAHRIVDCINRADKMIQDLLDASKLKAGRKLPIKAFPVKLNEITSKVIEEFSELHGNRFQFVPAGNVDGLLDGDAYRRVLENLLGNAVKHGAVESDITTKLIPYKQGVLLSVHNWGPIIPEEDWQRIFRPWERVEAMLPKTDKGWGIGLSLVEAFAIAHGGEASVRSTKEEGTKFNVYFPWQEQNSNIDA